MRKSLYCLLFLSLAAVLHAQDLRLSMPRLDVAPGQSVSLPMTVADFERIASLQFSINFDTAVIRYTSFELADLPMLGVGFFEASQGIIRASWFDAEGVGLSLPDGTTILRLSFEAVGQAGTATPLPITSTPIEIQVYQATDSAGVFQEIGIVQDTGFVRILGPLGLTIDQGDVSCLGLNNGFIDLGLAVDTSDYSVAWAGPNGFSAQQFSLSGLAPGTYVFTVRDAAQQVVITDEVVISEPSAALEVSLEVTDTDCNMPTGSITLEANGGTAPYTYNIGSGAVSTGIFGQLSAGTYILNVADANGCTWQDTASVIALLAPVIDLPDSLSWCQGQTLSLNPGGEGSFVWSTGETTDSISVAAPGLYTVSVTNASNCTATDSVHVVQDGLLNAILETPNLLACPGDTLHIRVSGGTAYRWLNEQQSLSADDIADPSAFPVVTTTYLVEVSNACGADTLNVPVEVLETTASAGADTCIARGDPVTLRANGGIFYYWLPAEYPVNNPTLSQPTAMPEDSTVYQVEITDANGCVTMHETLVLVASDPVGSILAVNLITPNADGYNDVLEFRGAEKFGQNSLKVYNRWGQLVYNKLNYQRDFERFDGTYQGEPLPAGSYFYVLEFRTGVIKQSLLIVRE